MHLEKLAEVCAICSNRNWCGRQCMNAPGQEWTGIMPLDHPFQQYWPTVNTEAVNTGNVNNPTDRKEYMKAYMKKRRAGVNG
jgi:hypothetical protein